RIHVAEDHAAAVLPRQPIDRDEISKRRRSREAYAAQVDHQLRSTAILQMRLVRGAQALDWGRVEPKAVPELADQDSVDVVCLERGFQHQSPAADSWGIGQGNTRRPEYRSTKSYRQAGPTTAPAR